MNIINILDKFTSDFNTKFCTNLEIGNLEQDFQKFTNNKSKELFKTYLEFLDTSFMMSEERKKEFDVKDIRTRKDLVTIFGSIEISFRRYKNRKTGKTFVFIRDVLNLKPYQRFTDAAEHKLIKCSMDTNGSYAAKNALRNFSVSRAKVDKIVRNLNGSLESNIQRVQTQPKILYIEMDEIHANLQDGTNHICPCTIVHEGHKEEYTKRKELKNIHYFATTSSYRDLWDIIYYYVDKKYDIDKFDAIFVSGDGAFGIKQYDEVFANATYVLDAYHYHYKYLNSIFKNNKELSKIADGYLREDKIEDFKLLVELQIEEYPEQEYVLRQKLNFLLNNIEGIKNQYHPLYKCPCSMEGHVSQAYARYITSSPYAFSIKGLENKLKLLTIKANKIDLNLEDFLNLKYGTDTYKEIIENSKIENIKLIDLNLNMIPQRKIEDLDVPLPRFGSPSVQHYLERITAYHKDIRFT